MIVLAPTYILFGCFYAVIISFSTIAQFTPPNSEIICGQNVGTKVVCGINIFLETQAMLKIWKKIVGAIQKLPAK